MASKPRFPGSSSMENVGLPRSWLHLRRALFGSPSLPGPFRVRPGEQIGGRGRETRSEKSPESLSRYLKMNLLGVTVEFLKISDLAPSYKNRIDCLSTVKQGGGWTMVDAMNLHQPVLFPKPTVVESIGPSRRSVGWWRSVSQWWCAAFVFNVWTQMFQKKTCWCIFTRET